MRRSDIEVPNLPVDVASALTRSVDYTFISFEMAAYYGVRLISRDVSRERRHLSHRARSRYRESSHSVTGVARDAGVSSWNRFHDELSSLGIAPCGVSPI